jgi:inorganic pyrophosphatase
MDDALDIVVEIPRGSRNKYEFDHERGVMRLDRRLFSATVYPADYGFVPETLAEDGDPLDALVLLEEPTFPGCWITARPVGVLWMTDDAGPDAKLICVEAHDPRYSDVTDLDGIQPEMLAEIRHFFEVYKTLEPDRYSNPGDYQGRDAAWAEVEACRNRYVPHTT